ncbi:MAG TPA: hypothetical protein VL025_16020 [Thermoanaerobaculia bacterium]|nr:hypothetical protein [Thermoanaerobaculia bacterium]
MPFRFKDLVVDVVGVEAGAACRLPSGMGTVCRWPSICGHFTCAWGTCFLGTCRAPTFVACHVGTLPHITTIIECTGSACGGSVVDPTGFLEGPQDLGVLKQQLQAQLAQVEQMEKQQAEAARPQSLKEAEDLERKLKGALEELQAIKKGLK